MFDLSFAEILLVVAVGVVFIGPKDMPVVLRTVAKAVAWVKGVTGEFRAAFDDLMKEAGVADEIHAARRDLNREFTRETRQIQGDDGDLYEAYDIEDLLPPAKPAPADDETAMKSRPHE